VGYFVYADPAIHLLMNYNISGMEKVIYVIGHRNPDTDSVVSAAAYAALKQTQGQLNYRAARAGNMNPQTEYVFDRFKAPEPEYLPDLIPKARYYLKDSTPTVDEQTALWNALELMEKENLRVLPIVDSLGLYKSMLHYRGFARYIITRINPRQKSIFPLSIDHLTETLRAQPIVLCKSQEVLDSSIIIAATYNNSFAQSLNNLDPSRTLVIMGDRHDLQRYCIEQKVRALILSNGYTLQEDLASMAEQNGVSVMSSPYDTSSTAMLIIYSVPVGSLGDKSVPLMRLQDPIRKIREPLSRAPSRCLPIGDDNDQVAGLLFEGDLLNEPNIGVVMVDHNEPSQAIEGIENYHILEVIDHHRLGNFSTRYPITFINKPVGATCTIITSLYREQRVPMKREIASILLCGILADTLSLKSATSTEIDKEAAEYLSVVTGLDIESLGRDLAAAANRVSSLPTENLISVDMKEYTGTGGNFSVSQVETNALEALTPRRDEILGVLEQIRREKGFLFSSLLATDNTALDSLFFVSGKKEFIACLNFPSPDKGVYLLKDVVSRKKQLIPLLTELVEKITG
jgi:manganese-dependent inorganic pyrophosphatase